MGVFAGILAGAAIMMLFEFHLIPALYPLPAGTDVKDMVAMKLAASHMPAGAFLLLLASYAIASLIAGMVATLVSKRTMATPAIVVGIFFTAGGIMNNLQIPHPLWFAIINLFLYLPLSYLGLVITRKKTEG